VTDDHARPSPLAGFWSVAAGGAVLITVILVLDPISSQEDCPNYHAAGNASAYADPAWDLYLPMMALAWVVLVVVEQFLPVTGRHRGPEERAVRALSALLLTVVASCCLIGPSAIVCH
jgi:hypothetical protein